MTADRLADVVGGQTGTDVASIYRNLETLEEVGLVRHFHLGHSPGLYVRAGDGACTSTWCAAPAAPSAPSSRSELDGLRGRAASSEFGWEAHFTHDPIVGLCPACAGGHAGLMSFEFLFRGVEEADAWLTGLFDGAPLLVALGIALVLGLRHASDPDHLVAVTSLVAADQGDTRAAARLGAWWGAGHAATLLVIGAAADPLQVGAPGLGSRAVRRNWSGLRDHPARPARVREVAARRLPSQRTLTTTRKLMTITRGAGTCAADAPRQTAHRHRHVRARRSRRSRSARCTGSPEPARSCCS